MSEVNMMVPLELDLIDEGRFHNNINSALRSLQAQLVKHVETYDLKALKAKAKLQAEIHLVCLDPEQGAYGCIAQIKTTLPSAPPIGSMLIGGKSQTGEDVLLCRKSGSTKDNPKQRVFSTLEGNNVDLDTGEVLEEDDQ